MEWHAGLETGDELVDRQHRALHEIFDELEAAEGRPEDIMRVLERLADYTLIHFATEEALMHRSGYPPEKIREHVALHQGLTEATRQRILEFRSGQLTETKPLVEFLREWIAGHLHEQDRDLVTFVQARGQAAVLPDGPDLPAEDTL